MTAQRYPYLDYLLSELAKHNPTIEKSFGRHVHWGYWDGPDAALCDDDDYARAAERLTVELCRLAGISEGDTVLDVGCGFGGTIASLNERFNKLQLTGLNIDIRQLARARQQVQPLGENQVTFCQGNACDLPFADDSFDRLLAVECIFHFPDREVFFREAHRVLRPGGVLVLSDFIPSPLYWPMTRLGTSRLFKRYNPFGHCDVQFTIGRYRRLARRTNFVPDAARNITRHTLPTYRYLRQRILRPNTVGGESSGLTGRLIAMFSLLGKLGLLNYYLLSFRRP
jgi:ubiquinone/menaquinone biosynthesis C-methylase UbiE